MKIICRKLLKFNPKLVQLLISGFLVLIGKQTLIPHLKSQLHIQCWLINTNFMVQCMLIMQIAVYFYMNFYGIELSSMRESSDLLKIFKQKCNGMVILLGNFF